MYLVEFENVPKKIYKDCFDHDGYENCRRIDFSEVIDWGKKEDMEAKIIAKKYNL